MSSPKAKPTDQTLLGDEIFMSAEELRDYMAEMSMAKMSLELECHGRADRPATTWSRPCPPEVDLTPQKVAELSQDLTFKIRAAGQAGRDRAHGHALSQFACAPTTAAPSTTRKQAGRRR